MFQVLSPKEDVLKEAAELGIEKEDADLLSNFVNSGLLMKEQVMSDEYAEIKELFLDSLSYLAESPAKAVYFFEKNIIPKLSKKADTKFYLDMIVLAFKDIVSFKEKQTIKLSSYVKLIQPLAGKLKHIEDSLVEIMKARSQLDLNISTALLLEHVVAYIVKE